jgi:hypothetical protein
MSPPATMRPARRGRRHSAARGARDVAADRDATPPGTYLSNGSGATTTDITALAACHGLTGQRALRSVAGRMVVPTHAPHAAHEGVQLLDCDGVFTCDAAPSGDLVARHEGNRWSGPTEVFSSATRSANTRIAPGRSSASFNRDESRWAEDQWQLSARYSLVAMRSRPGAALAHPPSDPPGAVSLTSSNEPAGPAGRPRDCRRTRLHAGREGPPAAIRRAPGRWPAVSRRCSRRLTGAGIPLL